MKTRPKSLWFFMLLSVGVALSFPLQIMLLYGHEWSEFMAVLFKITWLNWLVIGMMGVNAVFFWQASRSLRWSVPLAIGIVAVNNGFVGWLSQDFSVFTTTLGTLAFMAPHGFLLTRPLRELITRPDRQWWRTTRRINISLPVRVNPFKGEAFSLRTYDLSSSGLFIPLTEIKNGVAVVCESARALGKNDRLQICLTLHSLYQLRCEAEVVRLADTSKGRYPAGIGIRFVDLPRSERRELERLLESHAGH